MYTIFFHPPFASAMICEPKPPKGRGDVLSSLNMAIDDLNLTKEVSSITPAKDIFGSVGILLTTIRVTFILFCDGMLRVHTQPGHKGQRRGLCRTWIILRKYL